MIWFSDIWLRMPWLYTSVWPGKKIVTDKLIHTAHTKRTANLCIHPKYVRCVCYTMLQYYATVTPPIMLWLYCVSHRIELHFTQFVLCGTLKWTCSIYIRRTSSRKRENLLRWNSFVISVSAVDVLVVHCLNIPYGELIQNWAKRLHHDWS